MLPGTLANMTGLEAAILDCEDVESPSNCQRWKGLGYCEPSSGDHYAYSQYYCKRTCNFCPSPGPDPRPHPSPSPQPGSECSSLDCCVVAVNKYRAMAGKGPLRACVASAQAKAQEQCEFDSAHGAHSYIKTYGWDGMCGAGAPNGQCEVGGGGGTPIQDNAVHAYYNEGPGGGHYDILMNDANGCVACGVCTNTFFTHNFCSNGLADTVLV